MIRFKADKNLGDSKETLESIIGQSIVLHGNLLISKGVRVDGMVDGNILQQDGQNAVIAISEKAKVNGDVKADTVIVAGYLRGNIFANTRVELLKTARIDGNISYGTIGIEVGAIINGVLHQFDTEQIATDIIQQVKQIA